MKVLIVVKAFVKVSQMINNNTYWLNNNIGILVEKQEKLVIAIFILLIYEHFILRFTHHFLLPLKH